MSKNIAENISKNSSSEYTQKPLDHRKQSAIDWLQNASKRTILKAAEATCDLIGSKIADKITKNSLQICSDTQAQTKKSVEQYIYIFRKKTVNYWWFKINIV